MKDLSGTTAAVEKHKSTYKIAFQVRINRDHPERGISVARYTTWSGKLVLGDNTYLDHLLQTGEVRTAINPGGGLAIAGDWQFALNNPNPFGLGGRLSDMFDEHILDNDEVEYLMVFRDGTETESDQILLFSGLFQHPEVNTRSLQITVKDGSRQTLKAVPQELTDLVRFPNAPLNVANSPFPWPFGNLDIEPFNTTGQRTRLAPCRAVDIYDHKWTPGLTCKTYGQPYVFYRTARFYARIEDFTQDGAFFTIDTSARFTKIKPIRAALSNDVLDWKNVLDLNANTAAIIGPGDNLDLQMRGSPKLGTVVNIEVRIEATGSFGYSVEKTGESPIAGSGSGGTSIDLGAWAFDDDWDFEQIAVKIDGPGTGSASITSVTLDVTFDEQETGDNLAYPVYQAVVGYQDLSSQYQDGGVIVSSEQVLRNPIDVTLAMMRDRRTGMRMNVSQIETSNLAAERAKLADWYFDFALDFEQDEDGLSDMLRQGKIRLYRTVNNRWKLSVFERTDDPVAAFFADTNIATSNPGTPANKRESSFHYTQTPMSDIRNYVVVQYGWDPALSTYTEQLVASPHYLLTGTGALSSSAQTLTDNTQDFIADGVQVGYKLFMTRDKAYEVTSVAQHILGVVPVAAGVGISNRTDVYYVGPNFDFRCFRSSQKYKITQRLTVQSKHIQDAATAQRLVDHLVDYWATRRYQATFRTWLNAIDLELGDFIVIDHPDLPRAKRPVTLGTIATDISPAAMTIPLTGTGAALVRIDDRLVIKPGDARLYRECALCTAIDANAGEITVDRAYAGTLGRKWLAGDEIQRVITKWEVVELRVIRTKDRKEIEVTARETPRDYTPIGNAAPAGTPRWEDATPEQRALYGWATYPNGEVEWLNEDSSVSFARLS